MPIQQCELRFLRGLRPSAAPVWHDATLDTIEPPLYDDDYASCRKTFATLCLYHPVNDPSTVAEQLGLTPTRSFRQGDVRNARSTVHPTYPVSGWFFSTEESIKSRDLRRHLDYILGRLAHRGPQLSVLRTQGWTTAVNCFWSSIQGHGGPTVSPVQMAGLVALDLELSLDLYREEMDIDGGFRETG